ncbi:MAG TPA: right-handed parallel beta-helix repeat-containing protein [Chryseosolibacter sp.]|nr:right-handed parallel beta-helix repeat-containing protein [Chryseosolibacter sp.]
MVTPHFKKRGLKSVLTLLACSALAFNCADEEEIIPNEPLVDHEISATAISPSSCAECTYVVPSNTKTQVVDGQKLGLKPGDVICLSAANKYGNILFRNLAGIGGNPIVITNCGGTAILNATGRPYTMKTEKSKFIRIAGGSGNTYGIKLTGGHVGLTLEGLTTNVEVNNIEVYKVGFAGIMAKTDPTCDDATIRGNFVMRGVSLHHNYVHDTNGEAFYVGHSFYEKGRTLSCGVRLPHTMDGVRIFNNKVLRSGWDGIQVGCATTGAYVYNNTIEQFGYLNKLYHTNGIQFSEGTKGICYNNLIKSGPGIGVNVVGYGDSFVHDNVIIDAGSFGIFCDERTQKTLAGFRIINNTIINPGQDGIRMYNESVPGVVFNNIIVNPGSFSKYSYPRTGNDAYVYKLGKTIPLVVANNIFTRDINSVKFVNAGANNFRLSSSSPGVNKGKDISQYKISQDYYKSSRLKGGVYDIGASESY